MSRLQKGEKLSSSQEKEKTKKPESGERQDTTTGNMSTMSKKVESASVSANMAGQSKNSPAKSPTKNDGEIIKDALDFLQVDLQLLQSKGCKVAILAKGGILYASIEVPDHTLDTGKGHILLDGSPVSGGGE